MFVPCRPVHPHVGAGEEIYRDKDRKQRSHMNRECAIYILSIQKKIATKE